MPKTSKIIIITILISLFITFLNFNPLTRELVNSLIDNNSLTRELVNHLTINKTYATESTQAQLNQTASILSSIQNIINKLKIEIQALFGNKEVKAQTPIIFQDGLNNYNGTADSSINNSTYQGTGDSNILSIDGPAQGKFPNTSSSLEGSLGARTYIKFDLSSIPTGSIISSATLEIYTNEQYGNTIIDVFRADKNWIEGTQVADEGITRDYWNRGAGNLWNNELGDWKDANNIAQGTIPYATQSVIDTNAPRFISWNVTTLVQEWINGVNPNYGFVLTDIQSLFGIQHKTNFRSREHTTILERPKLTVIYSTGSEPSDTTPPVLSSGSPTGTLPSGTTQTTLSVEATDASSPVSCKYSQTPGTAYSSMTETLSTANGTTFTATIAGLTNGTSYNYYVRCQDTAGNANTTDYMISFSVAASTGDTTPPVVSITSPTNGATVSGTITVLANASDNVGISGVQFKLDTNTFLGTEDTISPYSYSLNTATITDGAHTLIAVARDTSNNYAISSIITITVNNASPPPPDTTAPSIPTNLIATAISSTQINLSWSGSTDTGGSGLAGYKIYRNSQLVNTLTGAAINYSDTGLTASTAYTYAASAYDAAGNESGKSGTASAITQALTGYGNRTYTDEQISALTPDNLNAVISKIPVTHPRVFFQGAEVQALKARVGIGQPADYNFSTLKWRGKNISFGEMASKYQTLKGMAQTYKNDPEGMWGTIDNNRDMGRIGWAAVAYAFVNLLEPDPAYITSATYLLDKALLNPQIAQGSGGGTQALGFSVAFDWLADYLSSAKKEEYIKYMLDQVESFGFVGGSGGHFPKLYDMTNLNPATGLRALYVGFAIFNDQTEIGQINYNNEESKKIIKDYGGFFKRIADGFKMAGGTTGGYYEDFGHTYMALDSILPLVELWYQATGENLFTDFHTLHYRPLFNYQMAKPSKASMFSTYVNFNNYNAKGEYKLIANRFQDSMIQTMAQRDFNLGGNGYLWKEILWEDSGLVSNLDLNALIPKIVQFNPVGWMFIRSGWGMGSVSKPADEFWAAIFSGRFFLTHKWYMMNSFSAYYKGDLLVNNYNDWGPTVYHNTIMLDNDRQREEFGPLTGPNNIVGWKNFEANTKADLSKFTRFEQGNDFAYALSESHNIYSPSKLDYWTREFVYLNRSGSYYLMTYDRMTTDSENTIKKNMLNVYNPPKLNGVLAVNGVSLANINSIQADVGGSPANNLDGRAFVSILLPEANNVLSINIPGNETIDQRKEMPRWGMFITPSIKSRHDKFLNVMQFGDSNTLTANNTIRIDGDTMVGALINDPATPRIVLFSKDQTGAAVSNATYTANYSSALTGKHLLTGITPGTYDIYKNGAKILTGITSQTGKNTLSFESTGGSTFSIVQTGIAPPVYQCSDSIDNDSDGKTDYPSDTGCSSATDNDETDTADITPSTSPTNLISTAVSSSQINLSWTASTDPAIAGQATSGVAGYKIYRCAGSGCAPTVQIATSATNSYSDTGLTVSTAYTYTVSAYDAAGNESAKSSSVSATTQSLAPQCSDTIDNDNDGKIDFGGSNPDPDCSSPTDNNESDTTPPVISSVISTTLASTTARIDWTTNEPATSQVEYGFTTQYGASSTLSTTLTTSHSVLLSNLSPDNTTYNYRVRSKDSSNNEAISTNRTFITPGLTDIVPPASTTDLKAQNITQTSVDLVTWTAAGDDGNQGTASLFDIRYATGELSETTWNNSSVIRATGEPTPKIAGSIMNYTLVGLTPNTTYKVALKTLDEVPNHSLISNIITFTTLKAETTPTPTPAPTPAAPSSGGGGGGGGGSTSSGGGGGGGGSNTISDTTPAPKITELKAQGADQQVRLTWKNPESSDWVRTILVRKAGGFATSTQDGQVVFEGTEPEFTDVNLKNNQNYYYSLFTIDRTPNYSKPATVMVKTIALKVSLEEIKPAPLTVREQEVLNLAGEAAEITKSDIKSFLSRFNFKRDKAKEDLSLKQYVKELIKDLTDLMADRQIALNHFIAYGTATTLKLGAGERAGVVNSYKSAFNKLPTTAEEWTDALKIGNGRWPTERSAESENNATTAFKKIYKRSSDRKNPHDDAAVTVMAYGLRPANRNLNSEKAAIKSFRAIYGYTPKSATDWDIVRAIAYSGAKR